MSSPRPRAAGLFTDDVSARMGTSQSAVARRELGHADVACRRCIVRGALDRSPLGGAIGGQRLTMPPRRRSRPVPVPAGAPEA